MKRKIHPTYLRLPTSVTLTLLAVVSLLGQTPTAFNYQAVLRDNAGNPKSNVNVSIELDIHQSSETGAVVYSETHNTTTNEFGIVNLEIGSIVPGAFAAIDWSAGPYFLEVLVDASTMGVSEFLSVPYARYAETADMAINDQVDDADPDPTNEIQVLSIIDGTIYLSEGGGSVVLPVVGPPGAVANDLMTFDGANWIARDALIQNQGGGQAHNNMQPYLGINHVIALVGVYPSRNAAEPLLAEIMMFAGNFAPRGWALCDGQLLSISSYTALFSLLGTTYGGDGRTTFGLPDLRGRTAIHPGTGPGLSNRRLGEQGGSETTTLSITQMPAHNHTITYQ